MPQFNISVGDRFHIHELPRSKRKIHVKLTHIDYDNRCTLKTEELEPSVSTMRVADITHYLSIGLMTRAYCRPRHLVS